MDVLRLPALVTEVTAVNEIRKDCNINANIRFDATAKCDYPAGQDVNVCAFLKSTDTK
jgi:hypothetical protein